jgi:hypothetical protein
MTEILWLSDCCVFVSQDPEPHRVALCLVHAEPDVVLRQRVKACSVFVQ